MPKTTQRLPILLGEPFWLLLLGVALTLPGKLVPVSWHPFVIAALFLFWLLRWWLQGKGTQTTPLNWGIYFILGWLPINLWASSNRLFSWQAVGYLVFGIAIFFACINWPYIQKYPQIIVASLLLFSGILAITSPFLVVLKPFRLFQLPLYDYIQFFKFNIGETIHLNVLAGALVLALPFWVVLVLHHDWTNKRWPQWICTTGALLILAVVIMTQSRGGYLAAGVAVMLILMLYWPRLVYLMPISLLIFGLIVWRDGVQPLVDILSSDGSLDGWDGRLEIWKQSLKALHNFAFTGLGIGTFTLVIPILYPQRINIEGYPHAHNLFLQIALDLGLPGLIAYLALLINLIAMLIVTLRKAPRHTMIHTLAIGAAGSLVGMLTHGLLDAVTWGTKLSFLPWILFALITQLFLHVQEDELISTKEGNPKSA